MAKHGLAVALHVLVKSDARPGLSQDHSQCFLAALAWIAPEVIAVQLDRVEGLKKCFFVVPRLPNRTERRDPVPIAGNRLSIDDAGAAAQAGERLNDQRKAMGEIIARTAIEPHL